MKVLYKRYNSQYCVDQCFECLSQAIHTLTQDLKLNEATAGRSAAIKRLDNDIQQAAAWYKRLVEGYNENELIIKEIKSELTYFNNYKIPYFNQVSLYHLKDPELNSANREAIHKRITQIKQLLDGINNIISKYLTKMNISDTALKLDQLEYN
jgi:hypothetical protein